MSQAYKKRLERDRQHHRKVMKKAIKMATPTKKKMEISCITGGIIVVVGCIAYPISKSISLGLLVVGGIQTISASVVKNHIKG